MLDIEIKILTPNALFFGPESKEDDHLTWISSQYEVIESNLKNWFISFSQKQNIKHWKILKRLVKNRIVIQVAACIVRIRVLGP